MTTKERIARIIFGVGAFSIALVFFGGYFIYAMHQPHRYFSEETVAKFSIQNPESTQLYREHIASAGTVHTEEKMVDRAPHASTTNQAAHGQKNDDEVSENSVREDPHDKTASIALKDEVTQEEPQKQERIMGSVSSYEQLLAAHIHTLTNEARRDQSRAPLIGDSHLADIARRLSAAMARDDFFGHVLPNGCDVGCRIEEGGYAAVTWSENIAWREDSRMPNAEALAQHFVERWLKSPAHRENMLSLVLTHTGIGVVREGDRVYVTVDFATKEW